MPQHESMPDTPRKSIQTARSLSLQEREAGISTSTPDASRFPATIPEESQSFSGNEKVGLPSLRDHQRFTAMLLVTRVEPEFPAWISLQ